MASWSTIRRLVFSLERGDAWDGKTEGYVPTVQGDDSIMWAPGGGGGGADLSAVDEDVTVLNEHKIELRGSDAEDSDARASLRFDDDAYSMVVEGTAGNGESDLVVLAPGQSGSLAGHWIAMRAQANSSTLFFVAAGEFASLGFGGGDAVGITGNLRFVSEGTGPIVASPDHSLHRLIVGDDGTVSSEPYTP